METKPPAIRRQRSNSLSHSITFSMSRTAPSVVSSMFRTPSLLAPGWEEDAVEVDLGPPPPKTKLEKDEISCFPWLSHHKRIQRCCTPSWYLVFLCLFVALQCIVVIGLFAASLSTLEKRYDLKSTITGAVASTYDVTVLCVVLFFSYYGGQGHTPRYIASGCLVLGLGCLLFAMPELFKGNYELGSLGSLLCPISIPFVPECDEQPSPLMTFFFIGQVVQALGGSVLYTLGPAYLDRVVPKAKLSKFLAVFYMFTAIGPAFGFVLGSFTLKLWVHPGKEPEGIDNEDSEWVGAWWIGFVAVGAACILASIPLFLFPRNLPNTGYIRERRERHNAQLRKRRAALQRRTSTDLVTEEDLKNVTLLAALKTLMKNRGYLFDCLAQSTEALAVAGFAVFLPKAVESIWAVPANQASLLVGLVIIPGAAGGVVLGGLLMNWLDMNERPVKTAKFVLLMSFTAACFMFSLFISCDTPDIAGVTAAYPSNVTSTALLADCNQNCGCNNDRYLPVCGGLNFFSPCHAGCAVSDSTEEFFSNCTCVTAAATSGSAWVGGGSVTLGKCSSGCTSLSLFLFLLFVLMVLTFVNNVPLTSILLTVVDPAHRSLGMGLQNVAFRVFGTIPAPIVFGWAIDNECVLWQTSCNGQDDTGSCHQYDTRDLSLALFIMAAIPKVLTVVFVALMTRAVKKQQEKRARELMEVVPAHHSSEKVKASGRVSVPRLPSVIEEDYSQISMSQTPHPPSSAAPLSARGQHTPSASDTEPEEHEPLKSATEVGPGVEALQRKDSSAVEVLFSSEHPIVELGSQAEAFEEEHGSE